MPTMTTSSNYTTLVELLATGDYVTAPTVSDVPITVDVDPYANTERLCKLCSEYFMYEESNERHLVNRIMRGWNPFSPRGWDYQYVCDKCVIDCDDCGSPAPDVSGGTNFNGTWLFAGKCESCSEDYNTCNRCDDVVHNDDVQWVYSDNPYCPDCRERVASWCDQCEQYEFNDEMCDVNDSNIHNYGYKPTPEFHGADPNNKYLYFGIELEVEAKSADLSEGAQLMTDEWEDFAYLKEDGSLNFGFEIVTHPASLYYYQNHVSWSTIDKLRVMGFRSWNAGTCGLHVHIDRRAFKDRTHLMAFSMLVNHESGLSRHIAGRNSSYGVIGGGSKTDNIYTIKGYGRGRGGDRYNAINLQNTATVEVRMFKGSLKVERILSGIEYCHALVTYSRDIRSGNNAGEMLRPEEFMTWIRKQGKYPNLVQFLPEIKIESDNQEMETED